MHRLKVKGLYSTIRSCIIKQYAVVLAGTFSLNSNLFARPLVALFSDSFCLEQSMTAIGAYLWNSIDSATVLRDHSTIDRISRTYRTGARIYFYRNPSSSRRTETLRNLGRVEGS